MNKIEAMAEIISEWSNDQIIFAWNNYCSDECMDDYIHNNDEYFFEEMFEKADEAVRAVCFGDYRYQDEYVVFSSYGNLDTFDEFDEANSPILLDILAEWMLDNHPENYFGDDEIDNLREYFVDNIMDSHPEFDRSVVETIVEDNCLDVLNDDWDDLISEVINEYNEKND